MLTVLSVAMLSGCSTEPETISYYKYTKYDDYKTTASEEEKGHSVYVAGKLISTEIMDINDAPYLVANVQEGKDKNWVCVIGQAGQYSDASLADYFGKKVRCFGDYNGKVDGAPSLKLSEHSDEYCINAANNEIIATNETLRASEDYAKSWFDSNADEVIYSEEKNKGKTGSYKSTGIVNHISSGDKIVTIELIQKADDTYYSSLINESFWGEPIESILNKYDEGDAVTVYFVIDEDGHDVPLCYDKANVDFLLTDYENEASDDIVAKKTYEWGSNGEVTLAVFEDKQTGERSVWASIEGNTEVDALGAYYYYLVNFEKVDADVTILASVPSGKQFISYIRNDGRETIMGTERDGSTTFSTPQWALLNADTAAAKASEYVKGLEELTLDFFNSIK